MQRRLLLAAYMAFWPAAVVLAGEEKEAEPSRGDREWKWTEAEQSKIASMLKKVTADDKGFWVYEQDAYSARTNLSARFTAEAALYTSYFVEIFPKIFPLPPYGNMLTKLAVTIYKTKNQYLAATAAPEWSAGVHKVDFSKPGWPILNVASYVADASLDREPLFCRDFNYKVLQHEAAHAMLQKFAGRNHSIPVFINEGCASYFEAWDLRAARMTDENRARRSVRSSHLGTLVAKLQNDPNYRPSLAAYLKIDRERWGSGEVSLHYAVAESFVDFLLAERPHRDIFKQMVARIYKRQPEVLTAEEISRLEPLWHEHIKNLGSAVARSIILNVTDEGGKPRGPEVSDGIIATGQRVTVKGLPSGVVITAEEFKTCKNLDDIRALVARKIGKL